MKYKIRNLKKYIPSEVVKQFWKQVLYDNRIKVCDWIRSVWTRKELFVHGFTNVLTN